MTDGIELITYYAATAQTPATSITYRAGGGDRTVTEAMVRIGDRMRPTKATADILELAFRYPQKRVSRAVLKIGDAMYEDVDGDGYVERAGDKVESGTIWRVLGLELGGAPDAPRETGPQYIYDLVTRLSGEEAMRHSFIATCGSTAADVHSMRGHSVLWASVPPGRPPNEVHRHLGGSVYCLFFRGHGRFHRVDPKSGFETIPIDATDASSFQMIAIPTHLWYQPINTGDTDLQYFMIHEPAFDSSELLVLDRDDCPKEWLFEF
jgi:hypothetical protein